MSSTEVFANKDSSDLMNSILSDAPAAPPAPAPAAPASDGFAVPSDVLTPDGQAGAPQNKDERAPEAGEDPELGYTPPEETRTDRRAGNAWTGIKRELKDTLNENRTLKAKLAEQEELLASRPVVDPGEVDSLRAKVQDYEARLEKLDLASSPSFLARFEAPMAEIKSRGETILRTAGHPPEEAKELWTNIWEARGNLSQAQAIIAGEPMMIQGALAQMLLNANEIDQKRDAALKESKATRAAMAEEDQRRVQAEMQKAFSTNLTDAVKSLRSEGSFLFVESNTDDAWNRGVSDRLQAVKGILQTGDPKTLLKYLADGVAASTYRKMFMAEATKASKYKQDLEAHLGSRPRLGGTAAPAAGKGKASEDKSVNPTDWLSQNL